MITYSDIDSEFVALSQQDRWQLLVKMFRDRDLRRQINQTTLINNDRQKRWREARRLASQAAGRWALIFTLLVILAYLVISRNWAGLTQLTSVAAVQTVSQSTTWAIVGIWGLGLALLVAYGYLMKDGFKVYYLMFANQEIKALAQLQTNAVDSESVYALFAELNASGYPKFAKLVKENPYETGRRPANNGPDSLLDRLKR
ncbi:hypothetical protein [Secundilactobacillus kimchicus]|uniref:hypothetical protein n=2 Tax=Secundilactobacillus kimchicus TaxID=528209 RepID=UPI00070526D1|nr:hypothetical protein [Secundilactobacillus kimchicus]